MTTSPALAKKKGTLVPFVFLFVIMMVSVLYSTAKTLYMLFFNFEYVEHEAMQQFLKIILFDCGSLLIIVTMFCIFFLLSKKQVVDLRCLCARETVFFGIYFIVRYITSVLFHLQGFEEWEYSLLNLVQMRSHLDHLELLIFGLALFAFLRIRMTGRVRASLLIAPAILMSIVCLWNLIGNPIANREAFAAIENSLTMNLVYTLVCFFGSAVSLGFMVFFARRGGDYSRKGLLIALTILWVVGIAVAGVLTPVLFDAVKWIYAANCCLILLRGVALVAAHFIFKADPARLNCSKCGKNIDANASFCPCCGAFVG